MTTDQKLIDILSKWLLEQVASYDNLRELHQTIGATLDHLRVTHGALLEVLATLPTGDNPTPFPYEPPVGSVAERSSGKVWPGEWVDANGYGRYYQLRPGTFAYHTGADLNLNRPTFDSDAHAPVYSIGNGVVKWVRRFSGWDWVIVTEHEHCLARYAHVENIQVKEGDTVTKGQHLADIGNAAGNYPYHLHFDIARLAARMATVPGDWPGLEKERVYRDYYDPLKFLRGEIPLD